MFKEVWRRRKKKGLGLWFTNGSVFSLQIACCIKEEWTKKRNHSPPADPAFSIALNHFLYKPALRPGWGHDWELFSALDGLEEEGPSQQEEWGSICCLSLCALPRVSRFPTPFLGQHFMCLRNVSIVCLENRKGPQRDLSSPLCCWDPRSSSVCR